MFTQLFRFQFVIFPQKVPWHGTCFSNFSFSCMGWHLIDKDNITILKLYLSITCELYLTVITHSTVQCHGCLPWWSEDLFELFCLLFKASKVKHFLRHGSFSRFLLERCPDILNLFYFNEQTCLLGAQLWMSG